MILRGLMDQSLGGFACIRGYAPMGELARISHADLDYQRDLIKTHRETVIRFLKNRKNLFFPEVILSCLLSYDFSKARAVSGLQPLVDVLSGKGFKSNIDGMTVGVKRLPFKGTSDSRAETALQIATLNVPDELLATGQSPLFRIDGNHRLSAADTESQFKDIVTPYCVILFGDDLEDKRNSKTIFHNINSKSIPLTSEENLKIILDDEVLFPDDALKDESSFGWAYLLARKIKGSVEPAAVPALKGVLTDRRAALVDLFKLLLEKKAVTKSTSNLSEMQSCLTKVHEIYNNDPELKANHCVGLFHAFVYFCTTNSKDGRLTPFTHWVKGSHLTAMKATDASALIEIFERVQTAKARTVFVSMQFGPTTDFVFDTILKAVDSINKECRPRIKVRPLRIDKHNTGHSYTITDAILTAIEESGLLIADLSQGNKNVYHEVGYVMGLNRAKGLKQGNFILIARDRPEDKLDKRMGFNLKGISQIRFKESIDLEEQLVEQIRLYYELAPEKQ